MPGRGLKTNVEFYTGLVLQSLGLKPRSFVSMGPGLEAVGYAHRGFIHKIERVPVESDCPKVGRFVPQTPELDSEI